MNSPLKWEVFISPQVAVITSDLPPGATERKWSPISSTLISGERDAVLVDTFITMEQNRALAEWVVASGKNLTSDLCDAWPWRSLLRCKHDSTALSQCAVCRIARGHLGDARATLTTLA